MRGSGRENQGRHAESLGLQTGLNQYDYSPLRSGVGGGGPARMHRNFKPRFPPILNLLRTVSFSEQNPIADKSSLPLLPSTNQSYGNLQLNLFK